MRLACDLLTHSIDVAVYRVIRVRNKRQDVCRQVIVPLMASGQAFKEGLAARCHGRVRIFCSCQLRIEVLHIPVHDAQASLKRIWHRLHCWTRLWWDGHLRLTRKRIAMDQCMSRGSSLDLSQPHEITTLEVAGAVLKLPKRRVRRACVKNVADWSMVSFSYWSMFLKRAYLCGSHTCSIVAQMMRYSYV